MGDTVEVARANAEEIGLDPDGPVYLTVSAQERRQFSQSFDQQLRLGSHHQQAAALRDGLTRRERGHNLEFASLGRRWNPTDPRLNTLRV